jgi:hypothetical protein
VRRSLRRCRYRTGFYPEGIAIGRGHEFYAGSLLDGTVYRGDLRTVDGDVLVAGTPGRVTAGILFDERSGLLWGVGSDAGSPVVLVYDGATGALVERIELDGAFLNDLVVTRDAVFVTDSLADVLWTIPLDGRGRPDGSPTALPLRGDFTFVTTHRSTSTGSSRHRTAPRSSPSIARSASSTG